MDAEEIARLFHDSYESLAPQFGYETRKESAVPWEQVPEPNRRLMTAVAAAVTPHAARAWIEANPAEAVKVLLETGALEPAGVLDTESGLLHVCGPDDEPEPQDVRVYRLVNEESTQ